MKTKLLNLIILLLPLWATGQSCGTLMTPITIEERISESTTIVEGIVTNSQSYWDTSQKNIYTVHTVNVYTNMLNSNATSIKIVTIGGQFGDAIQVTSSEADLKLGETGTFFLKSFTGNLNISGALYQLVGAAQGVVKYDKYSNKASDVFNQYQSVENDVYARIQNATNQSFQIVQARPVPSKNSSVVMATPIVYHFSPLTATAGTGTVFTITGANFGASMGTVGFSNASDGGASHIDAADSQILSWSDTSIQVEIPYSAGTGSILITNTDGQSHETTVPLTITYSHLNASGSTAVYQSILQDDDGNGGYTFQYHTDFNTSSAKPYFEEAFGLWNCESDINFTFVSTITTDESANDGINIVRFDNGSELATGVLGSVTTRFLGTCSTTGSAIVSEMDITWNDSTNWYYGSGTPSATQYDFKSVALHELGHAHQLGHVIDSDVIMHYSISNGESKYALNQNDIDAATYTMGLFTQTAGCGVSPMTDNIQCCDEIVITTQPQNTTVEANNGTAQFNIVATDYETIQWQESGDGGDTWFTISDNTIYSGATATTLLVTNVPETNDLYYRAVLTNVCGDSITSDEANLMSLAYTQIPDNNFEAALFALGYDDISGDNKVPTYLIENLTSLTVNNKSISDLTGIEAFEDLQALNAKNNNLSSLDLSANTALVNLSVQDNSLTALDLSNNLNLQILGIARNSLTSLDVSNNTLLSELYGADNSITSLDLSNNPNLTIVGLNPNALTSLDVRNGNNTAITTFAVNGNPNLACIAVDDPAYSTANWTVVDATASFSTSCDTYVPDDNFENYLETHDASGNTVSVGDASSLGNGIANDDYVITSRIESVTSLDINNQNIADLTGIEDFISLIYLNCGLNSFTSLDLSNNTALEILYCETLSITSLDISANTTLRELYCSETLLTSLDVSANTSIEKLYCDSNNDLTSLTIANNTSVKEIYCGNFTNIASLDVSGCTALEFLHFHNGNTTTLNTTNCTSLEYIYASNNGLTNMDISTNTALKGIDCPNNNLSSIVTTNNTALEELYCYQNAITELDLSSNIALTGLNVSNNNLTRLNVKNGNNNSVTVFMAVGNSDLQCISVDDAAYSTTNWMSIDTQTSFTENNYCEYTAIPDSNFESALEALGYDDISGDNQVPTALIEVVASLNVNGQGISDLTGIEDFTALEDLFINYNNLTTVNLSNLTNLSTLWAHGNSLSSLDVSNNVLISDLRVDNNNLISVDLSNLSALRILQFNHNNLTTIDLTTNTLLERLQLNYNELENLDLTNQSVLEEINVSSNNLEFFDFRNGNNTLITEFTADNNNLTCILVDDVTYSTTNWTTIDTTTIFSDSYCNYTLIPDVNFEAALEALGYDDISGDGQVPTHLISPITSLNVSLNSITDFTGIEDFIALEILNTSYNNYTSINLDANPNLKELYIGYSSLNSIDLSSNLLLETLHVNDCSIELLDLTYNNALTTLVASNNLELVEIDIQNGTNTNITNFVTTTTPNLNCIKVDDASYSTTNWTNIDAQNTFSESYCRYTAIPDTNFESALEALGYDDISGDGQVPTELIEVVTSLNVNSQNISDATGLEDFTALEELYIKSNNLTTLDVSSNTNLIKIWALSNNLTTLDLSNNPLVWDLRVENNLLTSVDFTQLTGLKILQINSNQLTEIDLSNCTLLERTRLYNNNLTSLDFSNHPNIVELTLQENNLTSLNVQNGNNTGITNFRANDNPNLTCILVDDVSYSTTNWPLIDTQTSFSDTYCRYTATPDANFEAALEALGYDDISGDGQVPTALIESITFLSVGNKNISDFTGIEDFTSIQSLYVHDNPITTIDLSNNLNLSNFRALRCNLTSLDLSANTSLSYLDITDNDLTELNLSNNIALVTLVCPDNLLSSLDVSHIGVLEELEANNNLLTSLTLGIHNDLVALLLDNNTLTELDLSAYPNLEYVVLNDNNLTALNLQSGSNQYIFDFDITNNPNLICVLVDDAAYSTTNWTNIDTQTSFNETSCNYIMVDIDVFLQGALLNPHTGEESLMRDDLRANAIIDANSPYSDGQVITETINLDDNGSDSMVDWIWVELRDATDPTIVIAGQSAILQRDGDVVSNVSDLATALTFNVTPDDYYVVVSHRNHLGIMIANAITLNQSATTIDFTDANNQITYGSNAQTTFGMPTDTVTMWAGDVNGDGIVQYSGTNPDTPDILSAVLNDSGNFLNFPTYTINAYNYYDSNLDGATQYSGTNPDVPYILQNVLAHPNNFLGFSTYQIIEQLPERINP